MFQELNLSHIVGRWGELSFHSGGCLHPSRLLGREATWDRGKFAGRKVEACKPHVCSVVLWQMTWAPLLLIL